MMSPSSQPAKARLWRTPPWRWPTVAAIGLGLLVGAVAGLVAWYLADGAPWVGHVVHQFAKPCGSLFLRLVFLVVLPLLASAIVLGVLEMKDVRSLGRVGGRTLLVTAVLVTCSVAIALLAANLAAPGKGLSEQERTRLASRFGADAGKIAAAVQQESARPPKPVLEAVVELLPQNPLADAASLFGPDAKGGGVLSLMLCSLIAGLAILACPEPSARPLRELTVAVFEASMKVIDFAMRLAPFAVACLMFTATATLGWDLLGTLARFAVTVLGALAVQMFVIYPAALVLFAKHDPRAFFRDTREAVITAFATSSSNATLPVSLRVAHENLRLPDRIGRFVLTVGATANQNGTALYEGVTVLFLAQVFGIDLTLGQQFGVAMACILAGVGTAGVPAASLPFVAAVVSSLGIPPESVALILGIDRLLDMCRTTLNVTGDLVCASVVASWEKP